MFESLKSKKLVIVFAVGLIFLSLFYFISLSTASSQNNTGIEPENVNLLKGVNNTKELEVVFYYGQGCPHCKMTEKAFEELADPNIHIIKKEVYFNNENRDEFTKLLDEYGIPMSKRGVPTLLWDKKLVTIGEMNKNQLFNVAQKCRMNCTKEVIFSNEVSNVETITTEKEKLTLLAVISAALVDSINPCTLAIMAMLLATIVVQKGRRHALWAGIIFTFVIFIMYSLIGLGIIKVVIFSSLEKLFFYVMMLFAFIMAIMEFKAYLDYKPGFASMEMPMWLRPYAKEYLKAASSPYTVAIAALGCSLFLLPCSSGPYLVILSLLAKAKTTTYILYLILYNLIFVIPMVLITFVVYFGLSTAEKIQSFRDKYIKVLHLFSGILMLILIVIIWAYIS